ncbi:FMN-binding negative transcriptional regulator [Acinetobacter nosocomialis]|uniref:FMN-binding negative transcriptional regulator n=1 Tax=Acinetobacter nosocomialis TaxID=106654 RepID=UPI0005A685FF|nr:FMN-binding negative transcriptional regulator [Acinetobacter nosocomialis]
MYIPDDYAENRLDVLHSLITEYPFGVLFTHGSNGLDANHLPFELQKNEGKFGALHAHVSRVNPIWHNIKNGDEVLVVFQAGDAYISPNWYPSKHEQHRQVPTWNYRVVHAHGKVTVHDDERYVRGVVARLTRSHEASQPEPWKMSDAPKDYLEPMLKAIVGIEIEITKLQGQLKLGQNKERRDILGAADGLSKSGHQTIANAMYSVAELNK